MANKTNDANVLKYFNDLQAERNSETTGSYLEGMKPRKKKKKRKKKGFLSRLFCPKGKCAGGGRKWKKNRFG